ncbi:hypothetical protein SUDANB140_02778 [Streptomyces sp. enrichment culture]
MDFLHVPGLLQTAEYARALFSYVNPQFSDEEIQRWVDHRMRRRVIFERPQPIIYEAVIHEAALRIKVLDSTGTRAQLAQILSLSASEHVTVRVIPFAVDNFAGAGTAMVYAGGPVPKLDTVVRDTPHGTVFVDAEAQLSHFRTLFRRVEVVAFEPRRSREFIHRLTKEL